MATRTDTAPASDGEIVVARTIEGPRPLVFEAYSDVKHLAHWWGPNGFTTTTQRFEFRPGGVWEFIMHGPDGTDPFVEHGGATEVTMRALFKTKAMRDEVVERYGAIEGGKQTLGRLATYVAALVAERER